MDIEDLKRLRLLNQGWKVLRADNRWVYRPPTTPGSPPRPEYTALDDVEEAYEGIFHGIEPSYAPAHGAALEDGQQRLASSTSTKKGRKGKRKAVMEGSMLDEGETAAGSDTEDVDELSPSPKDRREPAHQPSPEAKESHEWKCNKLRELGWGIQKKPGPRYEYVPPKNLRKEHHLKKSYTGLPRIEEDLPGYLKDVTAPTGKSSKKRSKSREAEAEAVAEARSESEAEAEADESFNIGDSGDASAEEHSPAGDAQASAAHLDSPPPIATDPEAIGVAQRTIAEVGLERAEVELDTARVALERERVELERARLRLEREERRERPELEGDGSESKRPRKS
ncbi:unnamed protein product [Chrysoparadoxa australica]